MRPHESMEDMLSRLMPVAFSEEGQRSLDAMLDELAGPEEPVAAEEPATKRGNLWARVLPPVGIAAAAALAFLWSYGAPGDRKTVASRPDIAPSGIYLLGETDRIERLTDEGWLADPQGGAMQAVRVQVVEENTLQDAQTGIIFQISEPREELILTPVTAF